MLRSREVTLGRAAEIAGMNYFAFHELWLQRGGRQGVEVDAADAVAQTRRLARRQAMILLSSSVTTFWLGLDLARLALDATRADFSRSVLRLS